jgi:uncharacterized protein YecT (DUF1311 family)
MMRALLALFICITAAVGVAEASGPASPDTAESAAAASELAARSGLPESELKDFLADCNANQQSMYFCAWRDQIVAQRVFERLLADKMQSMPACKSALESRAADWARSRDRSCARSALKQWGDGSMRRTAQIICVTGETARMTKRIQRMRGCRPGR